MVSTDPHDLLSLFALCIAIVAGGGFGLQRSRLTGLRGDVRDLTERVTIRDLTIADLQRKDVEKDAKLDRLEVELHHAEAMATRNQEWLDLDKHLGDHHKEAMRRLNRIERAVRGHPEEEDD